MPVQESAVILRRGDVLESVTPKENHRICMLVAAAVKAGRLVKSKTCTWCGAGGPIEGHHPDYARPFMVVWLCRRCHHQHTKAHTIATVRGKRNPGDGF